MVADFVHISDDAVVAVVENGCGGILVDGDELFRVNAGDMVDGAGYAEAYIELGLYHNTGLTDLKLIGEKLTVDHGSCTGKLAAEKLCKLSVFVKALVLYAVADADDSLAAADIELRIKFVCLVAEELSQDLCGVKVDVLLDELKIILLPVGMALKVPGRIVPTCGRRTGMVMTAMIFPPAAGSTNSISVVSGL